MLWRALKHVGLGFYIDIGAFDPSFDSVSRAFYEMGWRGVHVEPNDEYAEKLRRARPDESVVQAIISNRAGTAPFYEIAETGMSTAMRDIADGHRANGWRIVEKRRPTITLDKLFKDVGREDIHWLKIDVEGLEQAVLKGWRKSKFRPWIVLVEAIDPVTRAENFDKWEHLLLNKGYSFAYFDGINRYYISAAHQDLLIHFQYGPCIWDDFQVTEESRQVAALTARYQSELATVRGDAEEKLALGGDAEARANAEIRELRDRLVAEATQRQAELAQARVELDETRGERDRVVGEVIAKQTALELTRDQLAGAQNELRSARDELVETRKERDFAAGALGQAQATLEQARGAIEEGRGERSLLRDELDATRSERDRFFGELTQQRIALDRLGEQLASVQRELQISRDDFLDACRKRDAAFGELDETRFKLARVRALLSAARAEMARVKDGVRPSDEARKRDEAPPPTKEKPIDLPRANAWSSALTWRMTEAGDAKEEIRLARVEVSHAMAELGYDIVGEATRMEADVATIFSFDASAEIGDEDVVLTGQDVELGHSDDLVDRFNSELAGVGCTSSLGLKTLIDRGLTVPASVVGMGVDHWERISPAAGFAAPGRSFRFLHVSLGDIASGLDLLLESFGYVFSADDDVSLIVVAKSALPEEIFALLHKLRKEHVGFPDVVLIEKELMEPELRALYQQCDAFVAPTRNGGFGLNVAQALVWGLPVIATAWGGHRDYCDESNAWLVEYRYERAQASGNLDDIVWARPTANSLDDALWSAYRAAPSERRSKALAGRTRLLRDFTWKASAQRLAALGERCKEAPGRSRTGSRLGWITTWNVKCGIATYAAHLSASLSPNEFVVFAPREEPLGPDPGNCVRSWNMGKEANGFPEILDEMAAWSVDSLVIQFNYGFFNHAELQDFIEQCLARGIVVFVDLHSTVDPYGGIENFRLIDFRQALRKCHRILAHSLGDMERLKAIGLVDNVMLFPHGVLSPGSRSVPRRMRSACPLIASFGFCLPGKGLVELVEAVALLKRRGLGVKLRMLNAEHQSELSALELGKLREAIERLGLESDIELHSEFLDDDMCLALLSEADLIVNPYQRTNESASGSVRYGLAAGRPVAVTPISIFDDLGEAVFRLPGVTPEALAEGIGDALQQIGGDTETARRIREASQLWVEAHDYARQGARLARLAHALVKAQ
ncbi:FkbM family methyltransferase [Methylocystis sp. JR02]|uniref:FkbM family methyltransferase n=1 Tax=Methylocystis sp. JR02 TaxID=3046284 RepID=UPI0024B97170|nr:FkbM family methyltransferase [Methylocystis sp. JR02]MDJ0447110.1 FkbM family methyltransferase [Methylocystis sp. JR02]